MTDYIGAFKASESDVLQYGVKGMKWGIRKDEPTVRLDPATGKATTVGGSRRARKKLAEDVESNPEKHGLKRGPETPAQRYNRLLKQAQKEGGNSLSDEDLKFVGQRGDAIRKVNQLNEKKPGWIQDLARQMIRQQAQKQMNTLSSEIQSRYVGNKKNEGGNEPKKTKKPQEPAGFRMPN